MRRGLDRSRDAAVSSVVGTVLMLGITIAVFSAFSLVVIDRVTADDPVGARSEIDIEQQDGRMLLRHRGGEPWDLADGELLLVVAGSVVRHPLADLSSQVADGQTWHIGESLCLAGPQPPCLYAEGSVDDVRVVYAGELAFDGLAAGALTTSVATYVSAVVPPTVGAVVSLSSAQAASDSGAEAVLQEAGVAQPAGTAGPVRMGGTPAATGGALSPANVAASDDLVAQLDATGDFLEVGGFALPANVDAITAVTIGYEGRKDDTGGTSPTTRLDYRVGAGPYQLGPEITEGATTDTDRLRSLCTTQATCASVLLDAAAIQAMAVRVHHVADTNRDPLIDHVFVIVSYTTLAGTVYDLDVTMDFAGVPDAGTHLLELRYRVSGDTFQVQVWSGSGFVPRGALTATTATEWTYELTSSEHNGGAPRVRFVDLTTGTTQGHLFLDYVRVVGT